LNPTLLKSRMLTLARDLQRRGGFSNPPVMMVLALAGAALGAPGAVILAAAAGGVALGASGVAVRALRRRRRRARRRGSVGARGVALAVLAAVASLPLHHNVPLRMPVVRVLTRPRHSRWRRRRSHNPSNSLSRSLFLLLSSKALASSHNTHSS
jgi:hypothetical protein